MTQTTNAGDVNQAVTQHSEDDGSSYTDLSGWEIGITFDSWDRDTGSVKTVSGDEAIMGEGKLNLTGLTINAVYSDGDTTDLYDTVQTQFVTSGGGQFMVQHNPQGTSSGKAKITTNTDAIIDSFTPPGVSADDASPLSFSFHVTTSGFDFGTN